MASDFTEVVVEGVTITIPRQINDKEVDVVESEDIEIDQISVLEDSKLVLPEDIIEAAVVETDSDEDSDSTRVHGLINTNLQLSGANYVIVKADEAAKLNLSQDLVVKHDGKPRPFKCELCGKTFTKPEVMKRHKRSHNITKDFSCTFCHMTFHRRDCLTDHMRNHTGEKPFQCTVCNKKFTRGFVLLRHMKIHSDGELECAVCHKTFDRKDTYNDHMRNHTGEKPFKCRLCPKSFSRSFVLTKHEKSHAMKKFKYEDEYDDGHDVITTDKTTILVEDIEYEESDAATAEILIPDDFAHGVIEETAIELEADEVELDNNSGPEDEEVYSIIPGHNTLQSEVYVTTGVNTNVVSGGGDQKVMKSSHMSSAISEQNTLTLTTTSGQVIKMMTKEEDVVVNKSNQISTSLTGSTDNQNTLTLTTSSGQMIKMMTQEQYEKLLQAAKRNTNMVRCEICNKTFASDSTYRQHFNNPWEKGRCVPRKQEPNFQRDL